MTVSSLLWISTSSGNVGQIVYDALLQEGFTPESSLSIISLEDSVNPGKSDEDISNPIKLGVMGGLNRSDVFGTRIARDVERIFIHGSGLEEIGGSFRLSISGGGYCDETDGYTFTKRFPVGGNDRMHFRVAFDSLDSPDSRSQKGSVAIKEAVVKSGLKKEEANQLVDMVKNNLVALDDEALFRKVIEADGDLLKHSSDPYGAVEQAILLWVRNWALDPQEDALSFEGKNEKIYLLPYTGKYMTRFQIQAFCMKKPHGLAWDGQFAFFNNKKTSREEKLALLRWMLKPVKLECPRTPEEKKKRKEKFRKMIMRQIKILEETRTEDELNEEVKRVMIEDLRKQLKEDPNQ